MSRGQIFLIGAIAALGFLIMFSIIAFGFIRNQEFSVSSQILFKRGLSSLEAMADSDIIDNYLDTQNSSVIREVLESLLPPGTYYHLSIFNSTCESNSTCEWSVLNSESFTPAVSLKYLYTSVSDGQIYLLELKLAVRS